MTELRPHYVPEYYLKGFTSPEIGEFYMYFLSGEKTRRVAPRIVLNEKGYWSSFTEKILHEEIEVPANQVIEKIRNRGLEFEPDDKYNLARYIHNILMRVPKGREILFGRASDVTKEFRDLLRDGISQQINNATSSEMADELSKISVQIDSEPDTTFADIPQRVWERSLMPDMISKAAIAVESMRWIFLVAPPDFGFITSDNPVVVAPDASISQPPNGQFLFPIATDIALWGTWNVLRPQGYRNITTAQVKVANEWIVSQANKYVFHNRHRNYIETLNRKLHPEKRK